MPVSMNISAQGVAKTAWEQVFKNVGLPQKVISDWGPQFVSQFMKELCAWLGIERNPSTAYHPQTDDQTERVNQELKQYLRLYCNFRQNDWTEWLLIAEFTYNNRIYSSTGQSPFMVNLGRHPNTGREIKEPTRELPGVEQFVEKIKEVWARVKRALEKTNEAMKRKWDAGKRKEVTWKEGDLVWLDAIHYNMDQPLKKLATKRLSPFLIKQKVSRVLYKLKIPTMWKSIHPIINKSYLTPYTPSSFEQQTQRSSIWITNPSGTERIQEMKEILDSW